MSKRENTDMLRLVFPQVSGEGDTYTYFLMVDHRDFKAQEHLKKHHFKYLAQVNKWLPYKKDWLIEWSKEEFLKFRQIILNFINSGFLMYHFCPAQLCQWMRDLQIPEAHFALRMKNIYIHRRILTASIDFDVKNLTYDKKEGLFLGKIICYNNYDQKELDERQREDEELARQEAERRKEDDLNEHQELIFNLGSGIVH
jgi:hypothetical protein